MASLHRGVLVLGLMAGLAAAPCSAEGAQASEGASQPAAAKKAKARKKAAASAAKAQTSAAAPAPSTTPAPAPAAAPATAAPAPTNEISKPAVRRIDAQAVQDSPAPAPAAASSPPPTMPPPASGVSAPARREAPKKVGLGVALKLALMLPAGRTSDAAALADSSAESSRGVFGSGALQLRWGLPFLERALALEVESGFFQLQGDGVRAFANDPDFGPELSYHWKTSTVPLLVGASYRLPIPLPIPLAFTPAAGFAAVWVRSQATYTSGGTSVTDAPQVGWALGFYLGLEATFDVGLGSLLAEARYINARTDLGFSKTYDGAYNATPGDVEGTHLALGYRFSF